MLVLLDKDDTITQGSRYSFNVKKVREAVAKCQNSGIIIGLNSDSPVQSLVKLSEQLGMRGPIIAEKGAVVTDFQGKNELFTFNSEIAASIMQTKWQICQRTAEIGSAAIVGDVVTMIEKQTLSLEGVDYFVAMNSTRKASLLFFLYRTVSGLLTPLGKEELCKEIEFLTSGIVPAGCELEIDPLYSLGTIHIKGMAKRWGIAVLRSYYPSEDFIMIGNSMSDYCGEGVFHVAVANANKDYKEKVNHICQNEFEDGVVEFLENLLKVAC